MAKKIIVGLVGSVLLGVVLYGTSFFGMLRTAKDQIQKAADDAVPLEFKVADAERMVQDLDPEIRKYMRLIAEQQVDVQNLEKKIAKRDGELADAQRQILALNESVKKQEKEYVFDGTSYTHEQVSNDLGNKVTKFKLAKETLIREKDLFQARQEALKTNSARLEEMMAMKKDLESQIEFVKNKVESRKVAEAVGELPMDNGKIAQAKKALDAINKRLDVDEKVRAAEGRLQTEIKVPEKKEIRNVSQEVDELFGSDAKSKTDL